MSKLYLILKALIWEVFQARESQSVKGWLRDKSKVGKDTVYGATYIN